MPPFYLIYYYYYYFCGKVIWKQSNYKLNKRIEFPAYMFPCGSLHIVITTRGVIIWVELESCCTLWPTNWHEVYWSLNLNQVWALDQGLLLLLLLQESLKNLKGTKPKSNKGEKQGVFHNVWPLPFYIKKFIYLKAKRRIIETQIFHHAKI